MGFLFLPVVMTMAEVAFMGHDHTLHGHRLASLPYCDYVKACRACTKSLYLSGSCRRSPQSVRHCPSSAWRF
jgi:hypothetical protein